MREDLRMTFHLKSGIKNGGKNIFNAFKSNQLLKNICEKFLKIDPDCSV